MNLQEAFEKAWLTSSTTNISKEAAMNWFFEGVAAQKKEQPIRTADIEHFAKLRNANAQMDRYRQKSSNHRELYFIDFIRQFNKEKKVWLTPSEQEIEFAATQLEKMEEAGLRLDAWTITNIVAGRIAKYQDYAGFKFFDELVTSLYHRALK